MGEDVDRSAPEVQDLFKARRESSIYGYGFSFVHLREPATRYPYPGIGLGEDFDFMQALRSALGPEKIGLRRDERGICLHIMHGANTADSAVHRIISPEDFRRLAACQNPDPVLLRSTPN